MEFEILEVGQSVTVEGETQRQWLEEKDNLVIWWRVWSGMFYAYKPITNNSVNYNDKIIFKRSK